MSTVVRNPAGVVVEECDRSPHGKRRAEEWPATVGEVGNDADVDRILSRVTAERLADRCAIQGRDVTVLDAIFHVTEHFAYHLGQIILVAKMFSPGSVQFYEDAGGLAHPLWRTTGTAWLSNEMTAI